MAIAGNNVAQHPISPNVCEIFLACHLSIDETFILYARHELNGCISTQITQYNDSVER